VTQKTDEVMRVLLSVDYDGRVEITVSSSVLVSAAASVVVVVVVVVVWW